MWLALDLGNSALKGGLFDGNRLERTFRVPHDSNGTALAGKVRSELHGLRLTGAGLASVAPALNTAVQGAVQEVTGVRPLEISTNLDLPFGLAYATPQSLGADRLAATAAAFYLYRRTPKGTRAVVVVDAGTAVTYEVLDRNGTYRGGAIAPGLRLLMDALAGGTAQLHDVPLDLPPYVIGDSTRTAMQSGLVYGFTDSVASMLWRIAEELGETPITIATGGWADFLAGHVPSIHAVDPDLVLRGIRLLLMTRSMG